jgi:membrane protein DedA with SNARE-associated domain
MDKELQAFFIRVLYSMTAIVVWMVINMTGGIYLGWLFFENNMKTGNIVFYTFMVVSLIGLIWYLVKLWKGKMSFNR